MQISDRVKQDIDFLYDTISPGPYECMLCYEELDIGEDGLCDACRAKLLRMPDPTFLQPLDGITVGLQYTKEIATAVMNFKDNEMTEYAPFFTQYMSVPDEWHADILVPVPIHPYKKHMRGFNHSELLCAYLSHATGIPYSTKLLYKVRMTGEQKKLSQAERLRNIRGSFEADSLVKGLCVVIVDDVFTTGATVYECARILKRAGATKVYLAAATSPDR